MDATKIKAHTASLGADVLVDIAGEQWHDVMTDALYAACGTSTPQEMAGARHLAQIYAADILRAQRDHQSHGC